VYRRPVACFPRRSATICGVASTSPIHNTVPVCDGQIKLRQTTTRPRVPAPVEPARYRDRECLPTRARVCSLYQPSKIIELGSVVWNVRTTRVFRSPNEHILRLRADRRSRKINERIEYKTRSRRDERDYRRSRRGILLSPRSP